MLGFEKAVQGVSKEAAIVRRRPSPSVGLAGDRAPGPGAAADLPPVHASDSDTSTWSSLLALLTVVLAQVATVSVVPALAREAGIPDWQAGSIASVSALVVVLTSPAWGRRVEARGYRPVLVTAVGVAVAAVLAFVAVGAAGRAGALPPWMVLTLLLAVRGLALGTAVAAVGPAVQVHVVRASTGTVGRTAALGRAGAARGLGTLLGAGLAATLGLASMWSPSLAAVVLLLVAAAVLLRGRGSRTSATDPADDSGADAGDAGRTSAPDGSSAGATSRLRLADPRIRLPLAASVAVFLTLALIQASVGFLVQDRYSLTGERATAMTGAALLAAGLGSVLAQGVVVPRLSAAPWSLVRAGGLLAGLALAAYVAPLALPVLVAVALVFGLGIGFAAAGCAAAFSLAVGPHEQGGVAGIAASANALTFVVGPVASTAMYGVAAPLPALVGLVTVAAVAGVAVAGGREARRG